MDIVPMDSIPWMSHTCRTSSYMYMHLTSLLARSHPFSMPQFFLASMQPWQREKVRMLRPTTLHLDSTHATNKLGWPLFVLAAADNDGRGFPLAFAFAKSESTVRLSVTVTTSHAMMC